MTLPFLISANQSAYDDGRFISGGGRLISDLLEISNTLKLDGILATIDIQRASNSVDHLFLISTLERYGLGNKFVKWVKIWPKKTISAYLLILVLEIVFRYIEKNKNIKGINIINHTFLYTVYADDTTIFVKDKESLIEVMKVFDTFSSFSDLKLNKSKCEVAGIGTLKGVKMALYGMKCIDLRLDTVKILGIHSSYNIKIENDENF